MRNLTISLGVIGTASSPFLTIFILYTKSVYKSSKKLKK
nr:MAG TPA: hypothetical protein [Caudoviricetes sp.]